MIYISVLVRPYVPYINYAVNKNFIASALCENKDKPMMHCDGKCHLAKEIKKTAKEESKNQTNRTLQEDFVVICPDVSKNINENLHANVSGINSLYNDNYYFQNISLPYHPPKA